MYDGFQHDLAEALERGEGEVADFIQQTARDRGIDPWTVFEATARQRLAWEHEGLKALPARPRRRGSRWRVAVGLARRLLTRRGRRGLLRQWTRATLGAAGKELRRASRRLIRTGVRVARREARRTWKAARQWTRRNAAEWGRLAFGLGFWLVRRRWPAPRELRPVQAGPPRRTPPTPSPAVQALLDGYSTRESVYLFGARDPQIRDPADDWPGALKDFDRAVRNYVIELTKFATEEDARDQHRPSRDHRPGPRRNAPAARGGSGPRPGR